MVFSIALACFQIYNIAYLYTQPNIDYNDKNHV